MKILTKTDLKKEGYTFLYSLNVHLEVWENLDEKIYYDNKDLVIAWRCARDYKQCVRRAVG